MVTLISADGASVGVRPIAYQIEAVPEITADDGWDDWLMIRGDIRVADGRQWTFTDPCLTTEEARDLSSWLHAIAVGAPATQRSIIFTEPNIAFSVASYRDENVHLEVRFSYESLPPWIPRSKPGWRTEEYVVTLNVSRPTLAAGADAWDIECMAFPGRLLARLS